MKVIMIYEDCYGFVALAKNKQAAINYLVDNHWLDERVIVWNEGEDNEVPLIERLGENWLEQILTWDIDTFNNFFCEIFTLSWEKVVE